MLKVPGKQGLWLLQSANYNGIFREINGHDIQHLEDTGFKLDDSSSVYALVKRLEVATNDNLLDLDLAEFNQVLKEVSKTLIEKKILTPECWLELVFIANGKRFDPDYSPWLEVSITQLLGMASIAKKYLQSF
jgi:hypothetical protein